jgi:hypothetical protein
MLLNSALSAVVVAAVLPRLLGLIAVLVVVHCGHKSTEKYSPSIFYSPMFMLRFGVFC